MLAAAAMLAGLVIAPPAAAAALPTAARTAAAGCSVQQSGAAVPTAASGTSAVRTTVGVAKAMGIERPAWIIAVMVMLQESSIRNLANDGTTTHASWPVPGRDYWLSVTRLSLKYPHDKFGSKDGAHDTDSIGLYQQRPAYDWGTYGNSNGRTDPEGVVQRLLDPRWEAMAFFGGRNSAAPKGGLMDVAGWQTMPLTVAADAVQQSNHPDYYAQWESLATDYINRNQDAPAIPLPWTPGGGGGALACTSIPTDPARGEAGHDPFGALDSAVIEGTQIRVTGWAFDPDGINGTASVHFYDQGPFGTTGYAIGSANQQRPDVNRAFNVVGQFGYTNTLPWTGAGRHTICAYAINVGRGLNNPQLGCREVIIPGPTGSVDSVSRRSDNQIDVSGWAADPGAPGGREEVHIYVVGPSGTKGISGTFTGDSRPDVQRAVGWAGGSQGFHRTVPNMGYGENKVCVFAINVNPPLSNPLIACRTLTIPYPPVGVIDGITVTGRTALVTGWTYDQNSPGTSIQVHIYVNPSPPGVGTAYLANDPRPDVNSVMKVTGQHGFARSVALAAGTNTVCAFGIGLTLDNNTLIGCRTVQSGPGSQALAVPAVPEAATQPTATQPTTPAPSTPSRSAPAVTSQPVAPQSTGPSSSPSNQSSGISGSSTTQSPVPPIAAPLSNTPGNPLVTSS